MFLKSGLLFVSGQIRFVHIHNTNRCACVAVVTTQASVETYAADAV